MMTRKSRHALVLVGATVLLLAGVGVIAWRGPGGQSPAPGSGAAPVTTTPPPPSLPIAGPAVRAEDGLRVWMPGMLYRYALSMEQTMAFGATARPQPMGAAPLPGMHLTLQGTWNVGVVNREGERINVRVNLETSTFQMSVEGNDVLSPEVRRAMTTALELPFFLTFEPSGAVELTHFEEGVDELSRDILRMIVASSQFVTRGPLALSWRTQESDTTGQYVAEYQRTAAQRLEKKKQGYTHLSTPQGLVPMSANVRATVHTSAKFELGEDLWTQALEDREHLEMETGAGMPRATNELTLSLGLRERRMDPTLQRSLEARQGQLNTATLVSFQSHARDPLEHYRQILGKRTFDELIQALRSLPTEEKARDDLRTQVMEQLRALFMLRPEEALKVPDILRTGMPQIAASPMLGALSAASTPAALQSLATASQDTTLAHDVRMDAVSALGMAGQPSREGVDALRVMSRDADPMLRDTASLAFGNAAYQMQDEDARGAQGLVHELKNNYRAASTPEQQALALRVIGNTRDPDTLDTLREALRSPSVQVRQAAMEAVRNIPGPAADQLLSERLLGDPASEVRRAAVFACGFRTLGPLLPALQQAVRRDVSDGLRSDIVNLLGTLRGSYPEALLILQWVGENDPHPEIRRMATTFLTTSAAPAPQTPDTTPHR